MPVSAVNNTSSAARTTSASSSNVRNLSQPSSGADVQALQSDLKNLGYNPGPTDGKFGPRTEAAVMKFQRENSCAVDGVVGPQTRAAMERVAANGPAASDTPAATHADRGAGNPAPSGPVENGGVDASTLRARLEANGAGNLRRGASGPAVSTMQDRLKDLGYNTGTVDGQFGPRTEAAVRHFQRDNNLSTDGIAGPNTKAALANPNAPQASDAAAPGTQTGGSGNASDFVQRAMDQRGDRYVYGAETNLNDSNPNTFDCSELVQWAGHQAGVTIPDGSANQLQHVRNHGTEMSVEQAMRTPGALLFRPGHVAISLGNGQTIEARGSRYGVGVFGAAGRFTHAGMVPGMNYD